MAELYRKGLSLSDIAGQTGVAKATVRDRLLALGIDLRPARPPPIAPSGGAGGKGNVRPCFGFCYFQGRVTPDPREYPTLLLIHALRADGANLNRIAGRLNAMNVPARAAAQWNRNSVVNVLGRFEDGRLVLRHGRIELAQPPVNDLPPVDRKIERISKGSR